MICIVRTQNKIIVSKIIFSDRNCYQLSKAILRWINDFLYVTKVLNSDFALLFLALICSENLYLHSRTATLLTNCSVYGILNLQLHFYIGTAKCNFTFAFLKMILHVMTSHLLCVLSNGEISYAV